jgi:predicted outer membrane lipoprotein
MNAALAYFHSHRKWIIGALLAGASGILTYELGANSIWVTVIIPVAAVALGVNFVPNRHPAPEVPVRPVP